MVLNPIQALQMSLKTSSHMYHRISKIIMIENELCRANYLLIGNSLRAKSTSTIIISLLGSLLSGVLHAYM